MAWDGEITITPQNGNRRLAYVTIDGFDADGENLIDLRTLNLDDFYKAGIRGDLVPRTITWWTTSVHAGAVTDTVSIKLMASIRPGSGAVGVIWVELGEITDADAGNGGSSLEDSANVTEAAFPTIVYTQFDIDAITVGSGNTNTVHLLIGFGEE